MKEKNMTLTYICCVLCQRKLKKWWKGGTVGGDQSAAILSH